MPRKNRAYNAPLVTGDRLCVSAGGKFLSAPSVANVARDSPGRDQHGVEPQVELRELCVALQIKFGGTDNAVTLTGADRFDRLFEILPCLDFDERQDPAMPGDDVDFTQRCFVAPR